MNRKEQKQKNITIAPAAASKLKIGIVVAEFNADITGKLLEGAQKTLLENGVSEKNIIVVHVPGGFETPLACKRLATLPKGKRCDAIVAIGCVIRGDIIKGRSQMVIMKITTIFGIKDSVDS